MTTLGPVLTGALVEFIWQGTAIAAALWIMLALLARRSAGARYMSATGAMTMLALAPLVTAWRIYARPVAAGFVFPEAVSRVTAIAESSLGKGTSAWLPRNWLLEAWAIGVLVFSLRLIWSGAQVHRLRRAGVPADSAVESTTAALAGRMGLTRAVRVLVSTMAEVPSVIGWLRPVVLIPGAVLTGLTPEQLERVLAHELAHIRRHDYVINLLQVVVETLLFYHPAVWWASGRVRRERELCCDDIVVESCGDALCYARALTTLEQMRGEVPALALGSTGGALSFRVRRLVAAPAVERHRVSRLAAVAAMTLGVVCFSLSLDWTRVEAQSDHLIVPAVDPGIDVDSNGAALIHRTRVEYPQALKEKNVGGVVSVEATLDDRGMVNDARVVSGPSELRKFALASVLNWHFMPAGAGATRAITITFRPPAERPRTVSTQETRAYTNKLMGAFLGDQVREAEQRAATLRSTNAPPGELVEAERQLTDLRLKVAVVNAAEPTQAVAYRSKVFAFRLQPSGPEQRAVVLTQPGVETLAPDMVNAQTPPVIGRVEAGGLSDEVTRELLARLPAHAGDLLTTERLSAVRKAAEQFDEHFRVAVIPIPDQGETVALRIDLEAESR